MKKPKQRHHRREDNALHSNLADRLGPGALSMFNNHQLPPQIPRMPSPPRSTRDILTLITAAAGLALAARPDAAVELLPGTPTTVLVVSSGKTQAIFMLPVEHSEVLKALGQREPSIPDTNMLQLWEETRHAEAIAPDAALMEAEENWNNGGYHEG